MKQQKSRLITLLNIFNRETDEENPTTITKITARLNQEGFTATKKTIVSDMETLTAHGVDIICEPGKPNKYFVASRDFELAELMMLVDAVQAAKFTSVKKSQEIIKKLSMLTSVHQADKLNRRLYVEKQVKSVNESVLYTVDLLHTAINSKTKITFQYFEYDTTKKKQLKHSGNVEEEVIARETAAEQKQAAEVLWGEVDKLMPLVREEIIDYYKHGISHADKAEKTGENRTNITGRVSKGLKKLRNNPHVQEAAKAYLPSVAYHGGVRSFKSTGMSSTERAALQNIEKSERAEQTKISMKSTYKLINPAFFEGKNIKALARCIGIGASTIRQLHHGKSVTHASAEKIARFYGKPFDELFVIDIERAVPKGDPNNNYKVKKNVPKYILADSSYLNEYTRSQLNRDKLRELNTSVDTVEKIILKLRRGGRSLRETAERVAYVLDGEFGEMFVVESE